MQMKYAVLDRIRRVIRTSILVVAPRATTTKKRTKMVIPGCAVPVAKGYSASSNDFVQ